ncbi:acetyl-CoA synthetase-like protein, partial [Bimuria novae-zelandiae CBS 107.79]
MLQEACNASGARITTISELATHENADTAADTSELGEVYAKDSAMILYTSGSTGTPKGILLPHEGIRNWVEAALHLFDMGSDEIFLQQTSCSFDMCFVQIFLALCSGGLLCLVPTRSSADATFLTETIATEGITFTGATPSEYSNWYRYGDRKALSRSSPHWRTAMTGGEATTNATLEIFASIAGSGGYGNTPRLFNVYGPTETTVGATGTELSYLGDFKSAKISVGKPLAGYLVYVMDERLQPVPVGIQGEIVIGGVGVARGYLKNQNISSERFVSNPLAPEDYRSRGWTTMHRTGDVGRWCEDGTLLVEGRKSGDTQIKLRGLRIDLAEIENSMVKESQNALAQVVVSVRYSTRPSTQSNEGFLVAHAKFRPNVFSSRGEQQAFLNEILARLSLPQYMRPAAVFPVDDFPMMISGKLDRKAVAQLPLEQERSSSLANPQSVTNEPLTKTEARLKRLWELCTSCEISKQYSIESNTDFFHVGGNSTLLLKLQHDIRKEFGVSLTLLDLFQHTTL